MPVCMKMHSIVILSFIVASVYGQNTLVDVAKRLGANTLVTLVTKAGLTDTLESDGPFTVFAPSDEAFSKLPHDVAEALENNKTLLTEVLKYHVITGKVMSRQLTNDMTSPSLLPERQVRINVYQSHFILKIVTVNGCVVIKPDQEASNGVIHVIDKVVYPIPTVDMIDYVLNQPNLKTLAKGFSNSGVLDVFQEGGPFTLFAPTDEAFEKLPDSVIDAFKTNKTFIKLALTEHILDYTYYSAGFYNDAFAASLGGSSILVRYFDGKARLTSFTGPYINITTPDISVTNGVVYIIDGTFIRYKHPPPGK